MKCARALTGVKCAMAEMNAKRPPRNFYACIDSAIMLASRRSQMKDGHVGVIIIVILSPTAQVAPRLPHHWLRHDGRAQGSHEEVAAHCRK